jgi:tetratricopeptide (TPR) repeat protein
MAKSSRKKGSPTAAKGKPALTATLLSLQGQLSTWRSWLPQVLLISGLVFWIYWPSLRGGWVWDDTWYITTNPLVRTWTGLWKFWFQPGSWVEYYPLHETVLWLQYQIFRNDTLGYHLTNVFLHIINALLVWRLLAKFGLRFAWLGGLIFAVHPAQVESVAWISELKNTFSLPFLLLAMGSWIDYEEHRRRRDYGWSLGFFLAAMLCKIALAPFPVIILLYAWWKRGRIGWNDLKASVPFFVIAVALGLTTRLVAQLYQDANHGHADAIPLGDFSARFIREGLIATVYFSRSVLPVQPLLAFPRWEVDPHILSEYLPWLVLAAGLGWSWTQRKGWGRHAMLGLGFFLLNLVLVLGVPAISYMNFTWAMDHFLYVPLIGLIGLAVAALGDLEAKLPRGARVGVLVGVTLLIALMALASRAQAALFISDETFWTYALRGNPNSATVYENLGIHLLEKGQADEAAGLFRKAIYFQPDSSDPHYNLGIALEKMGREDEARQEYQKALTCNPDNARAYVNLGQDKRRRGDVAGAESDFRQALQLSPDNGEAGIDLGDILFQKGSVAEAIELYRRVLESNPDFPQGHYNLAAALIQAGQLPEAITHLEAAIALDPQMAPAHESLGIAFAQTGELAQAEPQFAAAVAIDPGYLAARSNLALALAQTGQIDEAIDQYQQILKLKPDDATAKTNLAKLQQILLKSGSGKN